MKIDWPKYQRQKPVTIKQTTKQEQESSRCFHGNGERLNDWMRDRQKKIFLNEVRQFLFKNNNKKTFLIRERNNE